jgi:hypothetical protein
LSFGDRELVAAFRRDYPWARLTMPDERHMIERVLHPGDVLYLPAGTCHRTEARGSSLSLTVSCWRTSVLELVWQELTSRLGDQESWRRPVPAFTRSGAERSTFPREAATFLDARLRDLRTLVNGWTPADLALTFFSSVGDAGLTAEPVASPTAIRRSDRFEVSSPIVCVPATGRGAARIHVIAGRVRLSVPSTARPLLEQLARRRRFQAAEALRWSGARGASAWPEVREALTVLRSRGVIRLRPEPSRSVKRGR